MVKTPRTRHSRPSREPRTIDLDPQDVKAIDPADLAGPDPSGLDAAAGPSPAEPADPAELIEPAQPVESADPAGPADLAEAAPAAGAERDDALLAVPPSEDVSLLDEAPKPEAEPVSTEDGAATAAQGEAEPLEAAAMRETASDEATRPARGSTSASGSPSASRPPSARESPSAPEPTRRSGRAGRFVAGLAGGVVALVLAALLQLAGLLGHPGAPSDTGGLQAQIDGLKAQVEAVASAPAEAGSAELAAGLDAVRKDVTALQEALSAGAAGDGPALQALDRRLADLEAAVAALGPASGTADDMAALGERITAVEAAAKAAQQAADGVGGRVEALEQSVAALAARVEAQANQPKIALAIATAALKSALDRGAPFVAELETFAAIAPDAPEIAALRAHAETGVATREALRAETEAAAAAMIAAANPADPDAGYFERLLQSAESLVSVRPVGEVPGAGVPETVARMEVALNAGDLDKALAEYETLPEAAKAAGAAFAERVKARRDVEALVDQAIANAMKA
jgi:hypothetical protein